MQKGIVLINYFLFITFIGCSQTNTITKVIEEVTVDSLKIEKTEQTIQGRWKAISSESEILISNGNWTFFTTIDTNIYKYKIRTVIEDSNTDKEKTVLDLCKKCNYTSNDEIPIDESILYAIIFLDDNRLALQDLYVRQNIVYSKVK